MSFAGASATGAPAGDDGGLRTPPSNQSGTLDLRPGHLVARNRAQGASSRTASVAGRRTAEGGYLCLPKGHSDPEAQGKPPG